MPEYDAAMSLTDWGGKKGEKMARKTPMRTVGVFCSFMSAGVHPAVNIKFSR